MRRMVLLALAAVAGCDHVDRGWRGNMAGDYRIVSACVADRIPAERTLREDQKIAILASGPRTPSAAYEARLQETGPDRFHAEMRKGSDQPAGLAVWSLIQDCADGGPDRIHPPGLVRAAL